MRVTMIVRCLAMMRGGGETRHLAWMRQLAAMGVDVDVITGAPWLLGRARHPVTGVASTVLRTPYLRDAVYRWQQTRGFGRATMTALHLDEEWFCRAAWRAIEARPEPPDLVHAHALHQTARLRRVDCPVVINLPGAPHTRYLADLRAADALVADGWAAEHLPAQLGRPVQHVPKGVDADRFSPNGPDCRAELQLQAKSIVVAVGRLVPIKNITLLVEALPLLRQRVPSAHLLIVGEGPERRSLQQRAERLAVGGAITFAGYKPLEELPPLYRTADVFALPSDFDNSPNVVLEAMACGLPVVATDVGGVREYVEDGRGGDLVPARDAARMADAVARWLQAPDRRASASAHNRRAVVERYSWRASARRLLDVYEGVIDARPQTRSRRLA
jgi:glycosyltransferase involved in cell wall biosynthesis